MSIWTIPSFALTFVLEIVGKPTDPAQERKLKQDQAKPAHSYQDEILPILKSNCNPCHFSGGKVYDRHPFDDYKTVATLGLKLNTRLKGKETAVMKEWIQAGKPEKSTQP